MNNDKWAFGRSGEKREKSVEIRVGSMGQDLVFLVTGGSAHLGAAAIAGASGEGRDAVLSLKLPGHREEELASELATLASRSLGRTVAVLAGIHLDRPSRQDIEDIVAEARREMVAAIEDWKAHQTARGRSGDAEAAH
ncbi:hypothetical protein [Cohnella thailandensis]